MKTDFLKLKTLCSLCYFLMMLVVSADITADRANVDKLIKEGNWKDAYGLSVKNYGSVSDENSHKDMQKALQCMQRLNKYENFESLIKTTDKKHAANARVLLQTVHSLNSVPKHGVWLDNDFIRGANAWGRRGSKGEYANVQERDRVCALQYAEKAYTVALKTDDASLKADVLEAWSHLIMRNRTGGSSWRLQVLTNTEVVPEVERAYYAQSSAKGAPVSEEGKPVFYEVPASYEVAKNDGERWRWLLVEIIKHQSDRKVNVMSRLASYLHNEFGVGTLRSYSWYYRMAQEDDGNASGIMQVHTLKDNETVARLANGVKRFELPANQNFIEIYKQLYESGNASSGDSLVSIYLDRRQYVKAAELLAGMIKSKGDNKHGSRQKRLDQIVEDWGMFEAQAGAFTLADDIKLGVIYRNADSVKLSLHKIDIQALQDDVWKYLEGNPLSVKWDKVNFHNLLNDVVNANKSKYVGDLVADKNYDLKARKGHWDTRAELMLPKVKKAGAYLVKAEMGEKKFYTLVWVDEMMIAAKEVVGGTLYFVADAETGEPIAEAELVARGYKMVRLKDKNLFRKFNTVTKIFTAKTDENGQVFIKNGAEGDRSVQWTVEARKGEMRAWLGNGRIWSWRRDDNQILRNRRAFGITSQPVYKPESEVKGKFWVRDVRYDLDDVSSFAGKLFNIEIYSPMGEKVANHKDLVADEFGGVPYSYKIDEGAKLGNYRVSIFLSKNNRNDHVGSQSFRVEQYKKPEYEVKVDAPSEPVKLGDKFEATVKATYYHGAPVTNAKVKVKVLRHNHNTRWFPVGRWDWLYGGGYGWLDVERRWYPGWSYWGCKCPVPFWYRGGYEQPEVVLDEVMEIGVDGTVKVTVDSALAKLAHGDKDHRYEIKVEVVDASRRTIFGSGSVLAARQAFKVTTWLNRGYAVAGERIQANIAATTLDGRSVSGNGVAKLMKVTADDEGEILEVEVMQWELKQTPAESGFKFEAIDFKVDKAGQYRFVSTVKDEKGREIEGAILFSVRGANGEEGEVMYNDLELITDKREYAPGDTVKLLVNTRQKNGVVLLSVRGSEDRRLLRLEGHSQVIEIPVTLADMPNFFVEAMTISGARIHTQVREVIVPPAKRVLNVEVLPSAEKFKPGEKGKVKIRVTGENGEPVKGDCVLTIYDKSLEYISGGSNVGEIRAFFWKWRRRFSQDAWNGSLQIAGGNVVLKKEASMQFLGAFGQSLSVEGKLNSLSVDGGGGGMPRKSMARAKKSAAPMANAMMLEKSEYMMAAGEEAGGAGHAGGNDVAVRKDFADLIKWAGSVKLDENGVAEVAVDYPDNLTTWKIQTWAMSHGTRVGQGSAEVITSKDLIIRLQAPRFFVEKDEVVLSAVVHNYHDAAKQARVLLELEGGTLDVISGELEQKVNLAAKNGEERVNWRVKVKGEGEAIIRMKVITDGDSDAMEMTFPVYVHGILKQMAWSKEIAPGVGSTKIEIEVPAERKPAESRLEVRYSPTIAGAMVDALPYLANYPYGCTEQTLNRFVPTVITQKLLKDMGIDLEEVRNKRANLNPQELGDDTERAKQWKQWQNNPVFSQQEVDKMVRVGVNRLIEMQLSDGGWGWFSGRGERSYPHTTAVVVHGLKIAKMNGAKIPEDRLQRGVQWLKKYEERETERIRMWGERKRNTKKHADQLDAFVRLVLAENGVSNKEMLGFQFRDKNTYGNYAKSLLGMSLHLVNDAERRDAVIRNIEQFLKYDDENQTAYLEMANSGYWWRWYGSEMEAHAWYLKLLAATKPESKQARGLVKYLINNRKHATYWNSTRDTAYCIEAIADYMKASGESDPEAQVEVLLDGKSYKKVNITKENLFSFDNKMTLAGDVLTTGKHTIEIRRKGKGALYTNAYLTVFTKEDNIKKAGLEVKVERRFYKLVPKKAKSKVAGQHGQVVEQKVDLFDRIPLKIGDKVMSGDTIEVELIMESKNDYEYLMFSDYKAAGMEAEKVRSGYTNTGSMSAYMEIKDEKVCFFVRQLPRGKHSLTYRLRAEIPGVFSALPAMADAMYAPELRANSDEMRLEIGEEKE